MESRLCRWGIAGAGAIASRFCHDITRFARQSKVVAIAARESARADTFAADHGVARAHGSYRALAEDGEVDAVYVAVIHPQHGAVVRLMLEHGKHVLVEKPAVLSVAEWDELTALAHARGVLLLEAMKVMCFPAWRALWAQLPERGLPHHLEAAFGSQVTGDGKLFDSALAGGANWDVGVYGLWLYAALCRRFSLPASPPVVMRKMGPSGVDLQSWYRFEGPFSARIGAAIDEDLPRHARLEGEGWGLEIVGKWWNPQQIRWDDGTEILMPVEGGLQFEADHLAELRAAGALDSPWLPQAVSRQVIGWLAAAACA